MAKEKIVQDVQLRLVDSAAGAALRCGISRRTWFRLNSAAKTPRCVRIGSSPRWLIRDLEDWIAMGCPDRQQFEARQKSRAAR